MKIIPPIRGSDPQGQGHYGAPRGTGKHNGVDVSCYKGSVILSITGGMVTKIGYPYDPGDKKKGHLRYVQVTFDETNYRYFYIDPFVSVGESVKPEDPLGVSQGLTEIYLGITDHIHFEIKRDGIYLNPEGFVK